MQVKKFSIWARNGGILAYWLKFTLATLTFLHLRAGKFDFGSLNHFFFFFLMCDCLTYMKKLPFSKLQMETTVCHCSVVLGVHSLALRWTLWEFGGFLSLFCRIWFRRHQRNVPLWSVLGVEVVARSWGPFNLPPPSLCLVEWCGGHPSSPLGLSAWRRPACVHAAWDAPPRTGIHWSVHYRLRSPAGKRTRNNEQVNSRIHLTSYEFFFIVFYISYTVWDAAHEFICQKQPWKFLVTSITPVLWRHGWGISPEQPSSMKQRGSVLILNDLFDLFCRGQKGSIQ